MEHEHNHDEIEENVEVWRALEDGTFEEDVAAYFLNLTTSNKRSNGSAHSVNPVYKRRYISKRS